ncbi:MAG: radical SAM protein [Verrucomicrobia bacterium]|nr:radical SAM protein [Verrucomicrobiota bacterium]
MADDPIPLNTAWDALRRDHRRQWKDHIYVYPVISRRSNGLSVGINLNLDRACNFNCAYCQVERDGSYPREDVDLDVMRLELDAILKAVHRGDIWQQGAFAQTPMDQRRLDNIAFSGNGEPTLCRWFAEAVAVVLAARLTHGVADTKIVLITNATRLHNPRVMQALDMLDFHNGEIWTKLDAGTQAYFETINRAHVPLTDILDNIAACGQNRNLVIQTLVAKIHGEPIPAPEFTAYCDQLAALRERGCRIARVQLYTVARAPAESFVEPLADEQLDELASRFRAALPTLPLCVYYR